ncbi:hypothetical protein C0991_009388 [Blastosporella zonata]|nr:hypothetical protein C0991_009388 [Blastosporella zonata]
MPNSKQKQDEQPYTAVGGRMGLQFTSPLKRRSDSKQGRYVTHLGNEAKRRRLTKELEALELADVVSASTSEKDSNPTVLSIEESQEPTPADLPDMSLFNSSDPFKNFPLSEKPTPTRRRTIPNRAANSLSSRWQNLLPALIEPFLAYTKSVTGTIPTTLNRLSAQCNQNCSITSVQILCLYHTREFTFVLGLAFLTAFLDYAKIFVEICKCQRLSSVLVSHGLFPTAPSKPRMAVSVHLLDFYSALFERSCDAVNALAGALNTFYKRRGFVLVDKKGQAINDPFRKGLGYAIQWYGNLHVRVEQAVEAALISADTHNRQHPQSMVPDDNSPDDNSTLPTQPLGSGSPFECARILQKRCPACFGGAKFGRSFAE